MLRNYLPLSKIVNFYDELDSVLRDPFPIENEVVVFEIPGFSKEDINVEIDQKECTISIKGEKEIYGSKRVISKTIRDYRLAKIDLKKVQAKVENGILTISLKDLEPKEKAAKKNIVVE